MSNESGFAWAVGVTATVAIFFAVLFVLSIAAWWKIFKKAGQPGWKSIVPLYNGHVLCSLCWKPIYFWITVICTAVSSGISQYLQQSGQTNVLLAILSLVLMIVAAVLSAKLNFKLAKSFGKGTGFGVGLWLLHTVFAYILAFGKAQYVGNASEAE